MRVLLLSLLLLFGCATTGARMTAAIKADAEARIEQLRVALILQRRCRGEDADEACRVVEDSIVRWIKQEERLLDVD